MCHLGQRKDMSNNQDEYRFVASVTNPSAQPYHSLLFREPFPVLHVLQLLTHICIHVYNECKD